MSTASRQTLALPSQSLKLPLSAAALINRTASRTLTKVSFKNSRRDASLPQERGNCVTVSDSIVNIHNSCEYPQLFTLWQPGGSVPEVVKGLPGCHRHVFSSPLRCRLVREVGWAAVELRLVVMITHKITCHPLCFCWDSTVPTGVCLVCGFSLITSPGPGLEAFHVALPFEWKLF